ncbi:MAG: 16S rRNA processing protein RimM [Clostridia bacterium]|nr:16S rRNA processing protein RimM [Clostridia bacterium]
MKQAFLEAGRVRNTHALKGEVKFEVWLDDGDALRPGLVLFPAPREEKPLRVVSSRKQGDLFLLSFEGVGDVDAASALKGRTLYIRRADADPKGDRIFFADLFDLPLVEDRDGTVYGTVRDVTDRGSGHLLVIALPDGREGYFPMVKDFIVKLDPEKEVRVRAPEGLFS